MVSINELNDGQKKLVYALAGELKRPSTNYLGLTSNQQEILNGIIIEFSLKYKRGVDNIVSGRKDKKIKRK